VKYGLPASDGQQFHASHFVVMQERVRFKELHFQHALRAGPHLRAKLDALSGQGAAPEPAMEEPAITVTPAVTAEVPLDLRAALGLR
jgi:hypothetical protein